MPTSFPDAESDDGLVCLPSAKTARPDERAKVQRVIAALGLCGLANDTKWNQLLHAIRSDPSMCPRWRCKCVGYPPSLEWDGEWFYHLPFPLVSLEWLDIALLQKTYGPRLAPPVITGHSEYLEDLLRSIGFDYHKGSTMIRIFGYSPKNWDFFDQ